MKFFLIATAATVPLALAAPTADKTSPAAAAVINEIHPIVGNITALQKEVNSESGGSAYSTDQLLAIQGYSNNLSADVPKLTSKVKSSKPFNAADSKSISNAATPLDKDTLTLLQAFIKHHSDFTASGVDSSVLSSLKSQKKSAAALSSAFVSKLASPESAQAKKEGAAIAAEYSKAIKTYS